MACFMSCQASVPSLYQQHADLVICEIWVLLTSRDIQMKQRRVSELNNFCSGYDGVTVLTCIFTKSRSHVPKQEVELPSLPDHPLGTLPTQPDAPECDALRHDGPRGSHLSSSSFYMAFSFWKNHWDIFPQWDRWYSQCLNLTDTSLPSVHWDVVLNPGRPPEAGSCSPPLQWFGWLRDLPYCTSFFEILPFKTNYKFFKALTVVVHGSHKLNIVWALLTSRPFSIQLNFIFGFT